MTSKMGLDQVEPLLMAAEHYVVAVIRFALAERGTAEYGEANETLRNARAQLFEELVVIDSHMED